MAHGNLVMNPPSDNHSIELREPDRISAISTGTDFGHFHGELEAKQRGTLIQWLNHLFPSLNLPINIADDELRACLSNGTVLCHLLNKIRPGSVNVVSDFDHSSLSNSELVKRFLAVLDGLGLPHFEISDLEKGSMKDVVDCLLKLREKSLQNTSGDDNISVVSLKSDSPRGNTFHNVHSPASGEEQRKVPSESKFHRVLRSAGIGNCFYPHPESSAALTHHVGHKFHEVFQHKHGSYADLPAAKISEMMKSSNLDNAPTQSLLSVANGILDESVERRNGEIPHRVACLLRKVVQEIERRISTQAEHLRTQNNLFKARDEKYQSRIRVLEALASGTREESEIVASQLQQLMTEKIKVEEMKKADEEDLIRLMTEKDQINMEISSLKQELETTKKTYELRCSQLEAEATGAKGKLKQKSTEYEHLLEDLVTKVNELEAASDSKYQTWNMKKNQLQNAVDFQFSSLKKLKLSWKSIKQDVMKEQRIYSEECNRLGVNLKPLVDAAEKYHAVLDENRKLFNEVQELKGNIRVYCRIRPFLPGLKEKRSIVEHVGENDMVVANPSKQGKEAFRSFKFNKVFGPAASQAEVYSDIQPFIRSVLDGYNACIFAYGQTGSGKTFTMSGPNGATEENYGVNYRALNDLFSISSSRTNSIIYEIAVQMVEIYNEQVRDLLSTGSRKRLGILTHAQPKGLAVPDASIFHVKSTSDVLELMEIGLKNRAMSATAMNERSSRSHSVVSIHVRGTDLKSGSALQGNLHLVDLAGSERVDRSEAKGDRLKETQHINRSLSALGDVIFALAQKSSHVPYRNSKLTKLLQRSLGGQAKTLMFVQLNPDVNSFSESMSTLKFAERVSGVELGAARSSKEGRDVRELMEQVASLKETISKKDEEIEQLQLLRDIKNVYPGFNSEKQGTASMRYGSSLPRKDSIGGTPKHEHTPTVGSNTHIEAHSQTTMDDLKHRNEFLQEYKYAGGYIGQSIPENADILGFAVADYDERLSDISDSGLSVGTEFDDPPEYKVLSQHAKSPARLDKSKAVPKVARGLQKPSIPSSATVSVTKDYIKRSPSIKRSISGGQLKASKRWQ